MYQVIARKFRPQLFEDVVGQEHVTKVIGNAIELGRLPHAFIFSGPRGVGKTSVARILARAVNCEKGLSPRPCNVCPICEDITASRAVDVFEIDAATHTQVEKIRDLIENARYTPAVARYKTFIIDEVHMLSRSAFNALLKTLEEPPPHVIFILATTELAKVPVTVLSRCQRYDFRRISVDDIVKRLRSVAEQERIPISDDAMVTIALQADGSMRDAQGMLEHISAAGRGTIETDTVAEALGLVGRATLRELLSAMVNKDAPAALDVIDRVYRFGQDLNQLYRSLLEQFRNMMVIKAGYANLTLPEEEMAFLKDLLQDVSLEEVHRSLSVLIRAEEDLKFSSLPRITLETILLRVISAPRVADLQSLIQMIASRAGSIPPASAPQASAAGLSRKPVSSLPPTWEGFLAFLRDHDHPLHAMVSSAAAEQDGADAVRLICPNQFLAEQMRKSLPEISKRAAAFLGKDIVLQVEVQGNGAAENRRPKPSEVRAQALKSPMVKEIMAEFNGTVKNVKPKE
ncbi:MAG TPA: DNA polymerase III subunit gamma/tau [Deltaproteobacteria bacterium]|nr:DNA polymerase III subunit gamma/tau [Deltaproteobacteria bacterium]HPR56456.1 DNA polymerase III subunit gamma/tau [Deltaproteobacteria bacterium]